MRAIPAAAAAADRPPAPPWEGGGERGIDSGRGRERGREGGRGREKEGGREGRGEGGREGGREGGGGTGAVARRRMRGYTRAERRGGMSTAGEPAWFVIIYCYYHVIIIMYYYSVAVGEQAGFSARCLLL